MSKNEYKCKKCGLEFSSPQALAGHSGSKKCDALSVVKEHEDRGLVSVDQKKYQNWIKDSGMFYEEDIIDYKDGNWYWRRPAKAVEGIWTRPKIREKAKKNCLYSVKRRPRYEKEFETEKFVFLVNEKSEDKLLYPVLKDDYGKTRKRIFKTRRTLKILNKHKKFYNNNYDSEEVKRRIYTSKGEGFGTLIPLDELENYEVSDVMFKRILEGYSFFDVNNKKE